MKYVKQRGEMERAIDTHGAIALNVITMIGIGPLITIPLVLAALGGALALIGWIGGAIVALCDGLVWAELSSRLPGSGGTYVYLRESFGRDRLGRALAFLFNWQFLLYAPCLLASGYIGFADYAAYFAPSLASWWLLHLCALCVGVVTIAVLARRTSKVASIGVLLGAIAVLTLLVIAIAALTHANWHTAMQIPRPVRFDAGLLAGFASALYITLYDYVGYADVALLGDEVRAPTRTIPRSIIVSIALVAALYIALQVGVLGVVPWHTLIGADGTPTAASQYVGALVVAHAWGTQAARAITLLVLVTAFASLYGNLLGFSRIPFAAARDGVFLPIFARLDARHGIPQTALLAVGVLSLVASFFSLQEVIAILTAGIVLIQSILQIIALALLRRRGPAPFRMPLYPLPALVAFAGWSLAFAYTGTLAIELGVGWLALGAIVFLIFAHGKRLWPFAVAALCLLVLLLPRTAYAAPVGAWRSWQTSRVVQMHGYPVFEVDGKPFFIYGAAFFYERIPRDQWEEWLRHYQSDLLINTIDLYVPWNWEEPTAGHLDFNGRTNSRRDLIGLLRIVHRLGFKVVLRPGPVIRNEWRNGGYPAWLLERPEYDMPLHDVLEGRYPATATLQNKHADAAASEWLHNKTHLRYAARWLHDVLSAVAPYSHDVIAIALDDDQGAYLDNDTWPAPHWHAYIDWLKWTVHAVTGDRVPVFVNTWQMKVTADSPVWAWTNWYQSDAYRIGAHDRDQIDLTAGLAGTQSTKPIMVSEFQAGWLQGADENEPRPADATNTALALAEFLADGAHGIVNFPVQDTIYPAGWEVPWANWAYDWDAAFFSNLCGPDIGPRALPTIDFGVTIARFGELLAKTHPAYDAEIVWPPSLFRAGAQSNATIAREAASTVTALHECHDRGLLCRLLDLRYGTLTGTSPVLLPVMLSPREIAAFVPKTRGTLAFLRSQHRLIATLDDVPAAVLAGNHGEASLLLSDDAAFGFVVVSNWSRRTRTFGPYVVRLSHGTAHVPRVTFDAWGESTRVIPVGAVSTSSASSHAMGVLCDLISDQQIFTFGNTEFSAGTVAPTFASATRSDVFEDGTGAIIMNNPTLQVVLAPSAGARIGALNESQPHSATNSPNFVIASTAYNLAATIGLFRDSVDPEPTPSSRDYIAAATHAIPAGTFNRPYRCSILQAGPPKAVVSCSYDAPDLPRGGARFERTLSIGNDDRELTVSERMIPHDAASNAHLKSISGFAFYEGEVLEKGASCFGIFYPKAGKLLRLCWRAGDLSSYDVRKTRAAAILTLHFKRNAVEMRLGVLAAAFEDQARALVQNP